MLPRKKTPGLNFKESRHLKLKPKVKPQHKQRNKEKRRRHLEYQPERRLLPKNAILKTVKKRKQRRKQK
jgi:hypothetical protein